MIKMKTMLKEQSENNPQIEIMDILQLVLDLENKVIEIKTKLKELEPNVNNDRNGRRTLDPKFFNKDVVDELPKKRPQ
tara:strand:- start:199 stop:432 length:234 start_codon:yes stop_codon:yes gene_type:complete